jgi:hypothetical protein
LTGALPCNFSTSALRLCNTASSTSHIAAHSTPGILRAFARLPNPILRQPINAITNLSALDIFLFTFSPKRGDDTKLAKPEVAISLEVLPKKSRRVVDMMFNLTVLI